MSSIYGYYGTNISSTSSSSTSLGISGLVSGLDIDSTVEAMCSGTTSKITKVQQNLMKLEWKQEAYQDVGTALTDFKDKYLSSTSSTSISKLLSNCYEINSNGDNAGAVTASGSPDIISNFSILGVNSLATNASYTSKGGVTSSGISSGKINLNSDVETVSTLEGKTFAFKIGSTSYSLTMDSTPITDSASMLTAVQNAIADYDKEHANDTGYEKLGGSGDDGILNVSVSSDGKLVMKTQNSAASDNINISSGSNSTVLKTLGLQKVYSSDTDTQGHYKSGTTVTGESPDYSSSTRERSFFSTLSNGASMTFDLDGIKATVKFDKSITKSIQSVGEEITKAVPEDATDEQKAQAEEDAQAAMLGALKDEIQSQLSSVYGSKVSVSVNEQGGITFDTPEGNSILSVASATSGLLGESGVMGGISTGDANRLLTTEALEESNFANAFDFGADESRTYDLNVNGVSFKIGKYSISVDGESTEYKNGVTMKNVMSAINNSDANVKISYLSTTDRFTVSSTVSGASGGVNMSGSFADMIFGDGTSGSGTVGTTTAADGTKTVSAAGGTLTQGTDAKLLVSFDGNTVEEITRATNSFKLDGLSLSLKSTFNDTASKADFTDSASIKNYSGAVTFDKTVNTSDLTDALKTMVEDYNSLISKVVDYYTTKSDSDYQPLTSDMVEDEDLTDDQAELYNNKAKEGVLFGDSILRTLTDDMRKIFTGLSSIGITTSSDYSEYGKLSFDADTFTSALESDTQSVTDLFTADSTGVIAKLNSMMTKYVNSSITSPGLITAKAGLASSSLSQMNCSIYTEQQSLEDQLSDLQDKLSTQQDRYYSQFTNMETQLNNIMNQSSYLSQLSF
jgi:flagellar hook-associated protein 2